MGGSLAALVLALATAAASERSRTSEPAELRVPEVVSPAAEAVALTWEAPAGCPDGAAVRRALAGYLGEAPRAEAGAAVKAVARVTRSVGAYRLVLRMETASGIDERETTAADCALLVDATAVIVAVAVDPATVLGRGDAAPQPVAPEPEPEPEPPEPTEPEPIEPAVEPAPAPVVEPIVDAATPEPAPTPERRARFGVRVSGGVDVGVLPGLAGGLRVAGSAFGRLWRAELRGDYWFPRTATVAEGIGGRVSLFGVGGRGCVVPGVARVALEFPLCAGLESGAMRGDPVGDRVASPTTSRRFWLAADGSAGVAWAPRRFLAFVLQAELVVPLVRAGFRVGEREVHRADPVAGRGLLGVEARFP